MMVATAELVHTIESETTAVKTFIALLEREQEMLVKGEVDDLIDLVRQKNGVAAELATLTAARNQALAAGGLAGDRAGMTTWLDGHPSETAARAAWSSLLAAASQARELNRVNGDLIQVRMQHNAQALEALLGSNASASLYGPDGQSTPPSGRRISDSA
ncbi:MAG: flagellar protein FlgN [Candidatus Accumulibacter sp.]|nr:flagellar protein FlgN [Accumulibacter sp.]